MRIYVVMVAVIISLLSFNCSPESIFDSEVQTTIGGTGNSLEKPK